MSRAAVFAFSFAMVAVAAAVAVALRARESGGSWSADAQPEALPLDTWGDGTLAGGDWGSYGLLPAQAGLASEPDTAPSAGGVLDSILNVSYQISGAIMGQKMILSINGIDRIKSHEKLSLTKYLDQGGKPTIGYGHLIGAFESFNAPITEARALELLVSDLATAEAAVNSLVKVAITQEQYDALVSFAYNVGSGAFRSSTLLRLLNAGDVAGAAAQFERWNKVNIGGQLVESAGLSNRRAAEAALFSGSVA